MTSLRGAKRRGNLFLKDGLLRCARNDGSQGFLRCTLGLLIAMTVVFTPCQAAVKFDGVNDYIDIKTLSLSNASNFTISTWVNLNSIPAPYATVISLEESIGYLRIDIDSSRQAYGYIFTGAQNYIGLTALNLNQWYNLTYTRNGTDYRFFVDGVLRESRSLVNPITGVGIEAIGARNTSVSNYNIDGLIDDTKIYNRPLSNGEILALYNSHSKRPSGTLANGLIAHYEMDDDAIEEITAQAKDRSGNLNHGQFIGFDNLTTALSNDVPAQIETAHSLEFDGVNDYIQIAGPNSGPLNNIGTGDFTISTWATNDGAAGYKQIISNWGTTGLHFLTTSSVSPTMAAYVGDGVELTSTFTVPNDNSWHHYVLRRDNGAITIWKDGASEFIGTKVGSIGSTVNTHIGSRGDSTAQLWDGKMDDLRVYDRSLSNGEIAFIYNGSGLNPGTANLEALWTFDDDSALKDSSGNNNHGVGVGGDSLKYTEGILRR